MTFGAEMQCRMAADQARAANDENIQIPLLPTSRIDLFFFITDSARDPLKLSQLALPKLIWQILARLC